MRTLGELFWLPDSLTGGKILRMVVGHREVNGKMLDKIEPIKWIDNTGADVDEERLLITHVLSLSSWD